MDIEQEAVFMLLVQVHKIELTRMDVKRKYFDLNSVMEKRGKLTVLFIIFINIYIYIVI